MTSASAIESLITDLRADRERLAAAVERIPVSLRGQRPGPDRWSVAEILEHLVIVEQRAAAIVTELAASAPELHSGTSTPTRPELFDRSTLRDRTRQVSAPAALHPTGRYDAAEAWAALQQSRVGLIDAVRAAEGRDLAAVTRTHPRLGTLTGYQWIAALGGHEERHAAQIEEIAESLTPRSRDTAGESTRR